MKAATVVRATVLAGGLALLGFGLAGFFGEPQLQGRRLSVVMWGAGAIALHDGVWVPVLLLAGALLVRAVPARVRGPVLVGLITVAALTAVGLPAVLREGRHNGNATLLPLAYLRNWLLLSALVAGSVALWLAVAALLRRKRANPRG